jgi:hypothetical protein
MARSVLALPCAALVAMACTDPSSDDRTTTATSTFGDDATTATTDSGTGTSTGTSDGSEPPPGSTVASSSGADTSGDGPLFDVGVRPDVDEPPAVPPTDIDAAVTADNAYAFGYGTVHEMSNYYGGIANLSAGDIFNCGPGPEKYLVPAADVADYLYIVSYADAAVTQGVLGQFRRLGEDGQPGEAVFTGDDGWEVCATGVDYDLPAPAPTIDVVNEQIEICNAGDSDSNTTSGGWVDAVGTPYGAVAVGEPNDTPYGGGGPMPGNEFPLVCETDVDPQARWMWFNWDPDDIVWPAQTPFIYPDGGGSNPMHDFMIFRLAATVLPQPPG